jgi:hypothetical protein
MILSSLVSLALCGSLTAASPVPTNDDVDYSAIIRKQIEKRQELGVIPGVPDGLAGFVPMTANMGFLPSIVKSINCDFSLSLDTYGTNKV